MVAKQDPGGESARGLALEDGGRIHLSGSRVRVAAIGIASPGYKASGGISASLQLTRSVADHCEAGMYIMSDRDQDAVDGRLRIAYRRPGNAVSSIASMLPRQLVTMMWRPKLGEWLRDFAPDVVHLHNPHPPGALALAARTCDSMGIPYVISTHGFVEFNDFSRGYGAPLWQRPLLERLVRKPVVEVARGAARVLMLSPYEESILRGMGVAHDRLRIVPNGVDRYFLEPPAEAERDRLVARFELPRGAPLLLFVGNPTVNKGLDVLLRALPMMRERAVAIIAGAIRSRAENEKLILSSGLELTDPRFRFTDYVTREELRSLYHSVDAFVFPSRADTLPLVILEAMAAGLPVVASNIGGIPYQVTADEGFLVPSGEPAELARALDLVCRDPTMRGRMGASGRRRVLEHFDWAASTALAVKIYEDVARQALTSRNGRDASVA